MKRKLVQQGTSTMMISLPSKWIKENKLGKGDEVDVEEINTNIHIKLIEQKKRRKTTIALKGLTESLTRTLITNAYRDGYETIEATFETEDEFNLLNQVIRTRLIGFDITNKKQKMCTIENITEPSVDQFENILDKLFINIKYFFELTEKRLQQNDVGIESYKEVSQRIQQYDNFCRRILVRQEEQQRNIKNFWTFFTLVIHGQRELHYLNEQIEKKTSYSKEAIQLLQETKNLFEILFDAYKNKTLDQYEKIHLLEKTIVKTKGYSLLKRSKGKETIILHHLLSAARKFYQANSPLLGIIA